MSTILFYFKTQCPVGCEYCFGSPSEDIKYDLNKMIDTFKQIYVRGDAVTLHGGEVCTLPIKDLRCILEKIRSVMGNDTIGLQTSLFGATKQHIALLKKFNVSVGVSVDGPPELNTLRGPRDPNANAIYQKRLIKTIDAIRHPDGSFGGIVVLTKHNATGDNLEKLVSWAKKVKFQGRFNPMFVPNWNPCADAIRLTPDELKLAWIRLTDELLINHQLKWEPMREFIDNLLGISSFSPCIVGRCDYTSTTCKTIMGNGEVARCDRCFQDGYYQRSNTRNYVRSRMLKITECAGCKYYEVCGGGCPGEAFDGDFRHKTYFCDAYYSLYEYLETRLRGIMPNIVLTVDLPEYFDNYELKGSRNNPFVRMNNGTYKRPHVFKQPECSQNPKNINTQRDGIGTEHGDHYDSIPPSQNRNRPHGDHFDEAFNDYNTGGI